MALIIKDRVQETTTTVGTIPFVLLGAVTGFQSLSVVGNSNTTYYCVVGGTEWEVGVGTYTLAGTTLSRDTILSSSNGGSIVNFSAGVKSIFVTYPAGKAVTLDDIQTLTNKTLTSPTLTTPVLGTPSSGTLTNCTFPTLNQNTTGTASGLSGTPSISVTNVTTSGTLVRPSPATGYMNGNYTTGESSLTSGCIYTIGGSYVPDTTTLGNMYGIGYGNSTVCGGTSGAPISVWGMYAASSGVSRLFLDSDNGNGYFAGFVKGTNITSGGNVTGSSASCTGNAATATTAANAIGNGQTWQTVTRANNTTYTNSTGRTICVSVYIGNNPSNQYCRWYINGTQYGQYNAYGSYGGFNFLVTAGATYSWITTGCTYLGAWELR